MKSFNYFFNPHMKLMTPSSIKFVAQHSLTFISKIEIPSCLMSMKDNPGLWARLLLVSLLPLRYLLSGSGILSALVSMRPGGENLHLHLSCFSLYCSQNSQSVMNHWTIPTASKIPHHGNYLTALLINIFIFI